MPVMGGSTSSKTGRPSQIVYRPWMIAVAGGTVAAALLAWTSPDDVERWFGSIPAVAALPIVGLVGYGTLTFLRSRGYWDDSDEGWRPGSFPYAVAGSVPFAAIAIAVDSLFGFSEDMNVAWPASVLFYPMIALVAEVLFHLAPLGAVVLLSKSRWSGLTLDARSIGVIGGVALVEPTFQVVANPTLAAFVFPHVYLIGFVQLLLLRKYGYVAMVAFRLSYYLLWHIVWGALRLPILF